MKNILVTGAAGFIGSNFIKVLINNKRDVNVISYDKLTYAGNLENLKTVMDNPRHEFVHGDINDENTIGNLLKDKKIDTIVHFAAESHVDNSIANPKIFLETNVLGTDALLRQAKKNWLDENNLDSSSCRFHHVSTDEVYGSLTRSCEPFSEKTAYAPNSPYSASKASSDHLVNCFFHTFNLPTTISNCSNNFGPFQHHEKLIPVVIESCKRKEIIPVYGDGSNIRDWLYVEDHCDAILNILERGKVGESYNVGGNNEIDNLSLVKTICKLMDNYNPSNAPHESLIKFVEDRKGHDWRYAINNNKVQNEIGWMPKNNFLSHLKKTIEFYL